MHRQNANLLHEDQRGIEGVNKLFARRQVANAPARRMNQLVNAIQQKINKFTRPETSETVQMFNGFNLLFEKKRERDESRESEKHEREKDLRRSKQLRTYFTTTSLQSLNTELNILFVASSAQSEAEPLTCSSCTRLMHSAISSSIVSRRFCSLREIT